MSTVRRSTQIPRKCYRLLVERFDGSTETVYRRDPSAADATTRTVRARGRRSVISCEELTPEDYARETEGRRASETIRRSIRLHCQRARLLRRGPGRAH